MTHLGQQFGQSDSVLASRQNCACREQGWAERDTRKDKLPFSGKEPVALTGTGARDEQSRCVPTHRLSAWKEPQGKCLWSWAQSHSPSRHCGPICISQPPPLPPCKQLSGKKACKLRDKRLGAGRGRTAIDSHGPHPWVLGVRQRRTLSGAWLRSVQSRPRAGTGSGSISTPTQG